MTNRAQVDLREQNEIQEDFFKFYTQIDEIIKSFELDQIVNMDETATQFDIKSLISSEQKALTQRTKVKLKTTLRHDCQ